MASCGSRSSPYLSCALRPSGPRQRLDAAARERPARSSELRRPLFPSGFRRPKATCCDVAGFRRPQSRRNRPATRCCLTRKCRWSQSAGFGPPLMSTPCPHAKEEVVADSRLVRPIIIAVLPGKATKTLDKSRRVHQASAWFDPRCAHLNPRSYAKSVWDQLSARPWPPPPRNDLARQESRDRDRPPAVSVGALFPTREQYASGRAPEALARQ